MIYERSQAQRMTNHEIAIAVAKKLGYRFRTTETNVYLAKLHSKDVISVEGVFKPYERWDDCMPIAVKYNMSLHEETAQIFDEQYNLILSCNSVSVQRAICELFLMMEL